MNRTQILALSAGQYLAYYRPYAIMSAPWGIADGRYDDRGIRVVEVSR